jgi:glycosyltransferase involved in cell wall biosynthesis
MDGMVAMDQIAKVAPVKLPLSVLILARNEEAHIERAVRSADFAAEVVVVDALSTDRTVELARAAGARVESRAWTNFGDQRNFSLSLASHPWVLVLDADEAITPALVAWLREFYAAGRDREPGNGYKIKRAEYFLGRRIHGACWNPSYQDRFFRRDKARYVGVIHEYPEVEGGMEHAPPEALLDHNPLVTVESFLDKMNRYTTIEAFDRYDAGQRTSISHLAVAGIANWAKNYFYYKGYRDGAHGFVICVMEGVSRTVRHLKLWQIQRMHETGRAASLRDPRVQPAAAPSRGLEARRP